MGLGLHRILISSQVYDYAAMNCMHRIAQQLLKDHGFTLGAAVIQRTGEHSMSFQTSLILLEDSINHGDMRNIVGQESPSTRNDGRRRREERHLVEPGPTSEQIEQ